MTKAEENRVVAATLREISETLKEVQAPGPIGYWFKKLAVRLLERARKLTK